MNSQSRHKSRKPANTAFKQQRLKAWQPLLTPKSVLPTLFIVGILFAPLGGFLLYSSEQVSELVIDYTNCVSQAGNEFTAVPDKIYTYLGPGADTTLSPTRWKKTATTARDELTGVVYNVNRCTIQFPVPTDFGKGVFLYYRLTNFYQNHRRYVKSFDPNQLKGKIAEPDQNCKPLNVEVGADGKSRTYYPCGLIANSMFNDTISNLTRVDSPGTAYTFTANGIAWPSDKEKYNKPATIDVDTVIPPINWQSRYPNGRYPNISAVPDFKTDERFQVWMRTAGLPNFRKLYGRNDNEALQSGVWEISVDDNFKVTSFSGTKSIIISTVSFLGGKNPFLGIAYMVVGCICIVLGVLFTARHLWRPRKLGDHTYLSWNQGNGNNGLNNNN